MIARFPLYRQLDAADCGPTCLRMIARYHGKSVPIELLRERCRISRQGVSLLGISEAAESIGFRTLAARISIETLRSAAPLPCIVHWQQNHFVVVHAVSARSVHVADPAHGLLKYTTAEFLEGWAVAGTHAGIVLLIEPTPAFAREEHESPERRSGSAFIFSYIWAYRRFLLQLALGVLVGSVLTLLLPFLTQAIVDVGINNQDIDFVYAVLLAQLMLFAGQTAVQFIRSWIILHIGARVNISMIADFLTALMKLPLTFFDQRSVGDLLQRIGDHRRIEQFLTATSFNVVFSLITLVVFSIVLSVYNALILMVFLAGTALALLWMLLFLGRRKVLDRRRFARAGENQSTLVQLIQGMPELKLNNCERQKRWHWERLQAALFQINVRALALEQYQHAGMIIALRGKDILISFLAARSVINGQMTLGMMLAVQFMIGQLNGPVELLVQFIHSLQDAALSAERIGDVQHLLQTEPPDAVMTDNAAMQTGDIVFDNIWFRYAGAPEDSYVLRDLSLRIPRGKVTAVVGASGSGKTTLLKLLLKFYEPTRGDVHVGAIPFRHVPAALWRGRCGVVMQDGFLFGDTIMRNIALGDDMPDGLRLWRAAEAANLQELIAALPLGFATKIGPDGQGLSQGQKQRILIARAVYREPDYFFLDEATSDLDAVNERTIMRNLHDTFKGRTVIIVAHRLSTVQRADQIVVLDKGAVSECGTHAQLLERRGAYFSLVRNQLELGA